MLRTSKDKFQGSKRDLNIGVTFSVIVDSFFVLSELEEKLVSKTVSDFSKC